MQEGVSQTIRSFSHLAHDMSFSRYIDRDEPSKAEKLLGGGNGRLRICVDICNYPSNSA